MDSNHLREQITTVNVNGKKYALVPLCAFHGVTSETVKNCYGLVDTYATVSLYEIEDERKLIFAKLKHENNLE